VSRHALESVRHSDALQQTVGYEQLEAYHVPFDELTGTKAVPDRLCPVRIPVELAEHEVITTTL
jgi:hypothetical protein